MRGWGHQGSNDAKSRNYLGQINGQGPQRNTETRDQQPNIVDRTRSRLFLEVAKSSERS